jgi:RimJ/RimL family protein N-acetyltransferase
MAIRGRKDENAYPFIVFDKLTNQYAGSTRFYDIQPNHQTTQLGYTWYGKAFQGTGLNKNCKFLLLQFAFDQLLMKRVEFRASSENQRSINAMIRIGCKVEGTLRDHLVAENGIRRSSIVLSILENEWHTGVKKNLLNKI